MKQPPRRIIIFLALALVTLALDQASKAWARDALGPHPHARTETVVSGYFDLRLSYNPGVAFGMLGSTRGARYFLTLLGLGAFAAIVVFVYRAPVEQRRLPWALGLIAGGAVGNVTDRVLLGHVTDFVIWRVGAREWPAFNVADAALVVGVALLFVDLVIRPKPASARQGDT